MPQSKTNPLPETIPFRASHRGVFSGPWSAHKTIPAAVRDSRYTIIIEMSNADADKPILIQNTRYSLADADKWLADFWERFGISTCVVIVARQHDSVGTLSAIVEMSKKHQRVVYAAFLNYSNAKCYTVEFSTIKQTPDWEWFMHDQHLPNLAQNYPALDMKKILLTLPSPTNSAHD